MEGYGSSSYGDAFADVYDDWYRDLPGTLDCVERLGALHPGEPLLELGAGTGRLAIPLAESGRQVVAVDSSAAMLERLREKGPGPSLTTVCADMARLPMLETTFGVVLIAFNTFFNLADADEQRRCLEGVRRLVRPDGALAVETIVFPDTDKPVKGVDASVIELDRVVITASRLDPRDRSVVGQHVELTDGGVRLRPWVLHFLLPDELDAMATDAGFVLDERFEDWTGRPFTEDSTHQVVFYRPA